MSEKVSGLQLSTMTDKEKNEDTEQIKQDIESLRNWLMKQPHLNSRTDDRFLLGFLRCCKYSVERAKIKLDNFLTMRTIIPELYALGDPMEPKMQELLKIGYILPLLKVMDKEESPRTILVRLGYSDPNKHQLTDLYKINNMINLILMLEDDYSAITGLIYIYDSDNVTFSHVSQITPTLLKKFVKILQDGLPFRFKGIHFLKPPSFAESLINFYRMFVKEKIKNRMITHRDLDDLSKEVSKSILPKELAGDAGPLQDLIDFWKNKVESYRDIFLNEGQYKSDESKRVGKPKNMEELFGMDGSFRQLQVD